MSLQVEYLLKFLFNRLYKALNLIEGFNYYFTLKQVITWEMITNFKLEIMSEYSKKEYSRIILHEWTFFLHGTIWLFIMAFTSLQKLAKNFKQFSSFG